MLRVIVMLISGDLAQEAAPVDDANGEIVLEKVDSRLS